MAGSVNGLAGIDRARSASASLVFPIVVARREDRGGRFREEISNLRHLLLCAAAGMAALTGVACGNTEHPAVPTTPAPSLAGPTWRLVSLEGRDVVAGTRVTASFGAGDRARRRACAWLLALWATSVVLLGLVHH